MYYAYIILILKFSFCVLIDFLVCPDYRFTVAR